MNDASDILLQDATTDQIIDELARRCESLVFARIVRLDAGREEFLSYYRGGLCSCVGICERTKARLLQAAMSSGEDDEDES